MATDSTTLFCTATDIDYVLSTIGTQLALDDDRSGSIATTPESTYLTDAIQFASAEACSYLAKRYDVLQMANSDAVREAAAVGAAIRIRRHRTDPVPESLQEWYDQVIEWYEKVRKGDADLGLIPERSPARPGVVNQRHDPRFPNPSRLEVNQSTNVIGRKPFGIDWHDNAVAGI